MTCFEVFHTGFVFRFEIATFGKHKERKGREVGERRKKIKTEMKNRKEQKRKWKTREKKKSDEQRPQDKRRKSKK